MIRVFSKQAFRFKNPNVDILNPNPESGGYKPGDQPKEVNFSDAYFDTVPGTIQLAPDWIKAETADRVNVNTFALAVKSGLLIEMPAEPQVPVAKTIADEAAEVEAKEKAQAAASGTTEAQLAIGADAQVAAALADETAKVKQREEDALQSSVIKTRKKA